MQALKDELLPQSNKSSSSWVEGGELLQLIVDTHVLPRVGWVSHVKESTCTGYRNTYTYDGYHLYVREPSSRPSVLPRDSHMGLPWPLQLRVDVQRDTNRSERGLSHFCRKLFYLQRMICQRCRTELSVKCRIYETPDD